VDPVTLQNVANWAEILGGLAVIGGVAFGVFQVAHLRGHRRDVVAFELGRSIQTPDFAIALRRVMALPVGVDACEIRRREGAEDAALHVSLVFESIGLMLHRGIVQRSIAWELVGGVVPAVWDRIGGWAEEVRREQANPKFEEWTEWLARELRAFGARRGGRAAPPVEAAARTRPPAVGALPDLQVGCPPIRPSRQRQAIA
jgi:hypothetical protein